MKQSIILLLALCSFTTFAQVSKKFKEQLHATVDENAKMLLDKSKANSVSIGIIKDGQVYTNHFGEIDKGKGNKATNHTFFEIASITKIFTGTLMAKAVFDGKINLDDDIRKHLDGSYPNLEYQSIPVKIKDLICFKSAFDKELPDNSAIKKIKNDSTVFHLRKMDETYDKIQFLEGLKTLKLDTIPGVIEKYSNTSLELSALILEHVYKKSYESLLYENIFSPLRMDSTKLNSKIDHSIANGYNGNHELMPTLFTNLWGAGGCRKSTMNDLIKFLAFELDTKNKIVQETQRNIPNSDQHWFGYFWDGILVTENGILCHKQGGSYGNQTFFAVYPEQQLGIVIIINQNAEDTYGNLFNTVLKIADDLKKDSQTKSVTYGYRLKKNDVIFTYNHPKNLDAKLIKSISVVGSFNDWNVDNDKFQMTKKGDNTFELRIPKSTFEQSQTHLFKFVINKVGWMTTPKNALNVDDTEHRNLVIKME